MVPGDNSSTNPFGYSTDPTVLFEVQPCLSYRQKPNFIFKRFLEDSIVSSQIVALKN